jgi:hypothetical protein
MCTPTSAWDRSPTDAELERFYGKDKSTRVHDEIVEVLTKTVRIINNPTFLSLPYVKTEIDGISAKISMYPLAEVISDYGTEKGPMAALMDVLAKSDCPHVAAYRLALAERYADAWADEVEEYTV